MKANTIFDSYLHHLHFRNFSILIGFSIDKADTPSKTIQA